MILNNLDTFPSCARINVETEMLYNGKRRRYGTVITKPGSARR